MINNIINHLIGHCNKAIDGIVKYFSFVSEGKVKGKLYDLGNFSGAVPTTEEKFITGELYQAKNENEFYFAIGQLDDYEGIGSEEDEIELFYRATTEVIVDGKSYIAWIYWYKGDITGKPCIESGDLIQYLQSKK